MCMTDQPSPAASVSVPAGKYFELTDSALDAATTMAQWRSGAADTHALITSLMSTHKAALELILANAESTNDVDVALSMLSATREREGVCAA